MRMFHLFRQLEVPPPNLNPVSFETMLLHCAEFERWYAENAGECHSGDGCKPTYYRTFLNGEYGLVARVQRNYYLFMPQTSHETDELAEKTPLPCAIS